MVEFYFNVKPLPPSAALHEDLAFCNLYGHSLRLSLKPVFAKLSHLFLICSYSGIFNFILFSLITVFIYFILFCFAHECCSGEFLKVSIKKNLQVVERKLHGQHRMSQLRRSTMQAIYNLMKTSVHISGGDRHGSIPARFLSVLSKHSLLAPTSSRILGYLDLWSHQVLSFMYSYSIHFAWFFFYNPSFSCVC